MTLDTNTKDRELLSNTSVKYVHVRLSAFVMPNVLAIFLAADQDTFESLILMDIHHTIGGKIVSNKEEVCPEKCKA